MTEIREGYKETEIGVIPEDWEVTLVENICDISTGSKNTQDKIDDGEYPFFVRSQNIERINSYSYDGEAILTAGDGVGTGKVYHYINGKFDIHQRVYMMTRFKENYSGKFFYYYFANSFYSRVRRMSAKNSVDSVRRAMIAEMKIPIPPLKEQEKIAEILSTTDKHIEDLDRLIEDYELLKKGMMQKLLTEGIGHTEFKDTELGKIPKEWEVKRIGDLSEIVTGKTPPTKKSELYGTLYPWVTPSDINHRRNINSTERMLSESGFESTSVKLPENTLLVTCIASIGKNAILKRDGSCNQQINAILPNNEVFSTSYLYYWVNQNKDYLISFSGQTAVPILNKTTFKSVLLALPPLAEQKKIASILSSIDDHINQLKETKDNYTNLKQALMDRLLTGKIRVV